MKIAGFTLTVALCTSILGNTVNGQTGYVPRTFAGASAVTSLGGADFMEIDFESGSVLCYDWIPTPEKARVSYVSTKTGPNSLVLIVDTDLRVEMQFVSANRGTAKFSGPLINPAITTRFRIAYPIDPNNPVPPPPPDPPIASFDLGDWTFTRLLPLHLLLGQTEMVLGLPGEREIVGCRSGDGRMERDLSSGMGVTLASSEFQETPPVLKAMK